MTPHAYASTLTKRRLLRVLQLGPQGAQPARMHEQTKAVLLNAVHRALRLPGSPAYLGITAAFAAEQNER